MIAEAQYIIVIAQSTGHCTEGVGLIYLCGRGRGWTRRDIQSLKIKDWTTNDIFLVMTTLLGTLYDTKQKNEWSFNVCGKHLKAFFAITSMV